MCAEVPQVLQKIQVGIVAFLKCLSEAQYLSGIDQTKE